VRPSQRRFAAKAVQAWFGLSQRRACRLLQLHRKTARYVSSRPSDAPLLKRLEELAAERRRFGYRRLDVLLRREGIVVNHKRLFRVYRSAHLQVRRRKKARVALARGLKRPEAMQRNEIWAIDFVSDTIGTRAFRSLPIIDAFTRECVAIHVDYSVPSATVTRVLDQCAEQRGYPRVLVSDNGPEFTSRKMLQWAARNKIELQLYRSRKTDAELLRRVVQWKPSRRMLERARLYIAPRGPRDHRNLEERLQRSSPS